MAFQRVPNAALLELVFQLDGQIVENTLGYARGTAFDAGQLEDLCAVHVNWWVENMAPILSADISLTTVKATSLDDDTGPQFILALDTPEPGLVAVDSVPNNVAPCISLRTLNIGRSYRGRNYIAGVAETSIQGSRIETEWATDALAAYNALIAGLQIGSSLSVISRRNGGVPRENGVTTPVVSVQFVDLVVDSQRRRLPGRGS